LLSFPPPHFLSYRAQYHPPTRGSSLSHQIETHNGLTWNTHKKGPPSDSLLGPHIQSICEALDIPHIETRFDIDHGAKEFSINLYPQQKKLNDAILETVKYLNWTRYAIIYEGNKFLLLKYSSTTAKSNANG
jgi:Receptor family ligand binding region